jgi:hypothetical protein
MLDVAGGARIFEGVSAEEVATGDGFLDQRYG